VENERPRRSRHHWDTASPAGPQTLQLPTISGSITRPFFTKISSDVKAGEKIELGMKHAIKLDLKANFLSLIEK
jgi:hypothetical protein